MYGVPTADSDNFIKISNFNYRQIANINMRDFIVGFFFTLKLLKIIKPRV